MRVRCEAGDVSGDLDRIEAAARELAAGPGSVSRAFRRRLAGTILACCARLRNPGRDVKHFYVQATLTTGCGVRVWSFPARVGGQLLWDTEPLCLGVGTLRMAEECVTCPACLDFVRANPAILRQQVVGHAAAEFVRPDCRHLIGPEGLEGPPTGTGPRNTAHD
jgi:hypothetical protein